MTITREIYGDKEGIIDHLLSHAAQRRASAHSATTQKRAERARGEAEGVEFAVGVLRDWTAEQLTMAKRLLQIHHELEAMSLQLENEELASKLDWELKSDLDASANRVWSAFARASQRDDARADQG